MMIQAMRAVLGPQWMPDEVRLAQSEELNRKRIESLLGVPVFCNGHIQAVVFPRSLLSAQPVTRALSPVEVDADLEYLHASAPAVDFVGSVHQTIGSFLCAGCPDIHRTAKSIGLSARTLQRRLAEEGESYHHLVDAVRLDAGIRLLRDDDTRLVDIAAELGYADQANFTRAFRRLTGMSPRAFRRAQS